MKKLSIIYLGLFLGVLSSCETEIIDEVNSNNLETDTIITKSGILESFEDFKFESKSNRGLDQCNTFLGRIQFSTGLPGISGANTGRMVVRACIDGFGPCATIFDGTVYNGSNFYFGAPNFSFDNNDRFDIKVTPNSRFNNIVKIQIGPAFQTPLKRNYFSQNGAAVGPNYHAFRYENCR